MGPGSDEERLAGTTMREDSHDRWKGEGLPPRVHVARHNASRQLVVPLAKSVQTEREADALFGGLENDEGRGLGAAQLTQKLIVHHHLRHAAIGQASDKTGAADILIVELQTQAWRQQHA